MKYLFLLISTPIALANYNVIAAVSNAVNTISSEGVIHIPDEARSSTKQQDAYFLVSKVFQLETEPSIGIEAGIGVATTISGSTLVGKYVPIGRFVRSRPGGYGSELAVQMSPRARVFTNLVYQNCYLGVLAQQTKMDLSLILRHWLSDSEDTTYRLVSNYSLSSAWQFGFSVGTFIDLTPYLQLDVCAYNLFIPAKFAGVTGTNAPLTGHTISARNLSIAIGLRAFA
ncbi:hypothetical protein OAT84_03050 [Gammaproteobacteria bacterium]|nr:hypothetical protein [Gammaproteobacteria bacterium]